MHLREAISNQGSLGSLFLAPKQFSFRSNQICSQVSRELELLWAPILLTHLGGLNIPCYNIKDNEQWGHHVMVAVTQVIIIVVVSLRIFYSLYSKIWIVLTN